MAFDPDCSSGSCVANLHATNDRPDLAAEEVLEAAASRDVLGGREPAALRRRPQPAPRPSTRDSSSTLESRFGLAPPRRRDSIDHLLARGLDSVEPPSAWPAERRDVPSRDSGLAMRLSDHAPASDAPRACELTPSRG